MSGIGAAARSLVVAVAAVVASTSWSPASGDLEPPRSTSGVASSAPSVGPVETVSVHARDVGPQVAVGWGGRTTAAVWHRRAPRGSDLGGRLFASVRTDGDWSDPLRISGENRLRGANLDVAAGRDGQVSVAWSVQRNGRGVVFETHREDEVWSTPTRLGTGGRPHVVVDGTGETSVMWIHKRIHVASRPAGGTWVKRVFSRGGSFVRLDLAVNRAGDEVAIWNGSTISRSRTSAIWSDVEKLPFSMLNNEYDPALGVFPTGRALATWNYTEEVFRARRSATGRWSSPHEFEETPGTIEQGGAMGVAVARNGHALIQWNASYGGTVVSRYRPGEGFGKPIRLRGDTERFVASYRALLLTPDGAALVVGEDKFGGAYRWQSGSGRRWRPVTQLEGVPEISAVDARGARMAVLFRDDDGLHVVMVDMVTT